ncbi:unnamed protein product [Heterotrigona itama]|uniref:Uncharacterized protein n=1 Tax=Heterotrigona itama TaxID=395501 RepID=A0A6V7GZP1_9HYME|nr:unnamed protein product [Heterotrigona itama]
MSEWCTIWKPLTKMSEKEGESDDSYSFCRSIRATISRKKKKTRDPSCADEVCFATSRLKIDHKISISSSRIVGSELRIPPLAL